MHFCGNAGAFRVYLAQLYAVLIIKIVVEPLRKLRQMSHLILKYLGVDPLLLSQVLRAQKLLGSVVLHFVSLDLLQRIEHGALVNDFCSMSLGLVLPRLAQPRKEPLIFDASESRVLGRPEPGIFCTLVWVDGGILEFEGMVEVTILGLFLDKFLLVENDDFFVGVVLEIIRRILLEERHLATSGLSSELQRLVAGSRSQ